ncbi:putative secondary metabolism biosyntheticenzyme [Clathrus columnatus]|uniref:Secondary metabolism biosyntheticenzyme n=1 Tax=Clathrus columnatus TaxID=1419009 RepID=A0AAV5A3F9_9AGAM|nr:putative secondary metabolism biosyntheticenzyme [Clathrus columnatus]
MGTSVKFEVDEKLTISAHISYDQSHFVKVLPARALDPDHEFSAKISIRQEGAGVNGLSITETQVPEPGPGEVLVIVHAVSLQYRDLMIADGTYPFECKDELVPCSDAACEIVKVGSKVNKWKVGDRVCANFELERLTGEGTPETSKSVLGGPTDGVLTQYRIFPAYSLAAIPEHLSYEEASTLPCAALTAYNALMGPQKLKGGDVVLVQGTGGVSTFASQFAVASGAAVIATSSSNEKLQISKKLGASHVINYKETPDWDNEVLKIVGGLNTMRKSLNSIRSGGWVHTIGFLSASEPEDVGNIPVSLLGKNGFLRGILMGSLSQFEDMNRLIAVSGLRPVIDRVFSFDQAKEAYDYLKYQKHVGKVVIKVLVEH